MCMNPQTFKSSGDKLVPCGKCPECRARRVSAWSFRLMQEDKHSLSSLFVTLTYDTSFVPLTPRGFMTVRKVDVQLFMKRLRKANKGVVLKYYLAAEYGGKTWRPHYHLLLFNADKATVAPAWRLGDVHFGSVTGASVGYTLKYMSKPKRVPQHKNDDRQSEFSLMSKRIGVKYLTDRMVAWHKEDVANRCYCFVDGKKVTMPRYYRDKIYSTADAEVISQAAVVRRSERMSLDIDALSVDWLHGNKESVGVAYAKMAAPDSKSKI